MGADRSAELEEAPEGASYCARHPQVETYLRCGRCDTPICPRCLVQTPVGARCPDCANVRRLPTFDVSPAYFARGMAAAVLSGLLVGGIWAYVAGGLGFGILFSFFVGMALGWAISESVSLATNRKRGLGLQICAVLGVLLAFAVQDALAAEFARSSGDLIAAGVGVFYAASRLRS